MKKGCNPDAKIVVLQYFYSEFEHPKGTLETP